jgi:hypothetical protein
MTYVTSAVIAGAITAVGGTAYFFGMTRSEWLIAAAYPLMFPGLFLTYLLGLGSGGDVGAVLHTDVALYVLTFLVWWGLITVVARVAGGSPKGEPD